MRRLTKAPAKPLAVQADQKGLELLSTSIRRAAPRSSATRSGCGRCSSNLVGNAIKFTERGHVLLAVARGTRAATRSRRCTSPVTDTGIGIPPEKHAAIFEAFSQADGSTTQAFGGTGLGLTIRLTLVKLMGGRIWVESQPRAGQHLPLHRVVRDLGAAGAARRAGAAAVAAAVLIVDDNAVNRRILQEQSRGGA